MTPCNYQWLGKYRHGTGEDTHRTEGVKEVKSHGDGEGRKDDPKEAGEFRKVSMVLILGGIIKLKLNISCQNSAH